MSTVSPRPLQLSKHLSRLLSLSIVSPRESGQKSRVNCPAGIDLCNFVPGTKPTCVCCKATVLCFLLPPPTSAVLIPGIARFVFGFGGILFLIDAFHYYSFYQNLPSNFKRYKIVFAFIFFFNSLNILLQFKGTKQVFFLTVC